MFRLSARMILASCFLMLPACLSNAVVLHRGDPGPAFYRLSFDVGGDALVDKQSFDATVEVATIDSGAVLTLDAGGGFPVTATLRREGQRLVLDTVEGISASTAGEADLAAITSQIDTPLPDKPVAIGDEWTAIQTVSTSAVEALLTSKLTAAGYDVIASQDAMKIRGDISGELQTTSDTATFAGTVKGTTRSAWSLTQGRLLTSATELVWTLQDGAQVNLRVTLTPITRS